MQDKKIKRERVRMSSIQMLDATKKKKIVDDIAKFGIEKVPHLLIKTGKERIIAFSGSLSREEVSKLTQLLSVEGAGLYFGKETFSGVRLSIDMLHTLKDQIKEKIELNKEQEELWFSGKTIDLTEEQQKKYKDYSDFVVIISGDEYKDIIGTGKISADKKTISNFLPKERRVKS
jgi:NOL1/NOP2/fmu family ribosome biogenesis protein